MPESLTGMYDKDLDVLRRESRAAQSEDVTLREFTALGRRAAVLYVDGLAGSRDMERFLLFPLLSAAPPREGEEIGTYLCQRVLPLASLSRETEVSALLERVFSGDAALLMEGMAGALAGDVKAFVKRGVGQPVNETVVSGPHEGFTESLRDNVVLVRRLMRTPKLISESAKAGGSVPVRLCLLYVDGAARQEYVEEVRRRLRGCRAPYVSSMGMLEQLLEDRPFSLLPQIASTERPDRAASFLWEGQIVILMENAPMALALPAGFLHLFHAPDDTALRWQYGAFLRLMRLAGMGISLLLPGVFLSLTVFHPEGMSLSLLTSVVESQARVPLTLFASLLLMLLVFALVNEAASRIPGAMGASLSIVSGLILGQAAVEADLFSPLVLIVVALSGLGGYTAPTHSLTLALRIAQLLLAVAAGIGGYLGMLPVLFFLLVRWCGLSSLGFPYLAPLSPKRRASPDGLLRFPVFWARGRGPIAEGHADAASPWRGWARRERRHE